MDLMAYTKEQLDVIRSRIMTARTACWDELLTAIDASVESPETLDADLTRLNAVEANLGRADACIKYYLQNILGDKSTAMRIAPVKGPRDEQ